MGFTKPRLPVSKESKADCYHLMLEELGEPDKKMEGADFSDLSLKEFRIFVPVRMAEIYTRNAQTWRCRRLSGLVADGNTG